MALDPKRILKPVRKLRKLVRKLDREPLPEKVHDLRTSTRRFEAMFEALTLDAQGVRKSVVKELQRCRKRAGKVRDMDVLTDYVSNLHLPGEEECTVRLLEHLGARRQKYASKLFVEVRRHRPDLRKDLRHTVTVLDKLIKTNGDSQDGSNVRSDAAGTAVKLAVDLASPQRLNRDNLHPYRLKVKELRNILQMGGNDTSRFIDDLGNVKDAIGEWHDWEELISIAGKELKHGNRCGLLAELKRVTARKYDHALTLAHTLRKNYLRSAKIPREPVWEAIAMLAG